MRELDTLGIAYHSPALNPFCDKLRRALSAVVPNPKERSKRWLSTCYSLDSDEAGSKTCGPDYHVRLPLLFLLSQDFLFCIAFCSLLGTLSPCNDLPCPMQKSNLSPLQSQLPYATGNRGGKPALSCTSHGFNRQSGLM